MGRRANVQRTTKETDIKVEIDLDSPSKVEVHTGFGFFDHMLTLMSAHGQMSLEIEAKGDLEVDSHHTVEDVGICVGQALKTALGDMKGINRYGQASIPMDEALASITLDISNRPYLAYNVSIGTVSTEFEAQVFKEFFRAFAQHAGITLHINVVYGENTHHILEAVFKGVGRALSQAAAINNRIEGVPSTKGVL
jgi:imidazoleglycerol-phosphate dehydratase